jgi:hypothetical protein
MESKDGTGGFNSGTADIKAQLAMEVGGAIVGGLLSSLLSQRPR